MYQVIGHPRSRTIRVLWALEAMGLDYDVTVARPQSPEILAINPNGKMPVLMDGDLVVPDSVAAITYLADKHGQLTYPAGSPERAKQDSLTFFALDELDATLWTYGKSTFALPEQYRVPEIKKACVFEWNRACETLGQRLSDGPFVMGETFTIADIVIGHCGGWAKRAEFDWPDSVADYFARMMEHPALLKAYERGDEFLAAQS